MLSKLLNYQRIPPEKESVVILFSAKCVISSPTLHDKLCGISLNDNMAQSQKETEIFESIFSPEPGYIDLWLPTLYSKRPQTILGASDDTV